MMILTVYEYRLHLITFLLLGGIIGYRLRGIIDKWVEKENA